MFLIVAAVLLSHAGTNVEGTATSHTQYKTFEECQAAIPAATEELRAYITASKPGVEIKIEAECQSVSH